MDQDPEWPKALDHDKPNVARMYDYLLGGYSNFEADRQFVDRMLHVVPYLRQAAYINRAFLRRAVTYLVQAGIDQFLDIGSGLPTMGNVHEVAQALNPAARVVYVDIDPVAVAHARAMLSDNPAATAIRGDLARPQGILNHPEVAGLLDLTRPLGVVLVAVLHFVTDDAVAYAAVDCLRQAMAPGSYLVIAHGVPETRPAGEQAAMGAALRPVTDSKTRLPEQVLRFFEGLQLVEPGLVRSPLWRPEGPRELGQDTPEMGMTAVAVARKP